MANARNGKKAHSGRDAGGFVALPWSVLDCHAYAALSANAKALLLEVARQYCRDNNGRLLLSRAYMSTRGWKSVDMIAKGKQELLAAGFIHETVKGQRPNKASWYAVTWQSLDKIQGFDPGAALLFQRSAYLKKEAVKNAPLIPSHGTERAAIAPPHGTEAPPPVPPHGAMKGVFQVSPVPPHGHHLEKPSPAVVEPASSSALTAVASERESAPATSTDLATQPEAFSTLADLWAAVGCRSVWTKPTGAERDLFYIRAQDRATKACQTRSERMQAAMDAEAHANARHVRNVQPVACVRAGAVHVDHDGVIRVRNEHAHDLAAWAD